MMSLLSHNFQDNIADKINQATPYTATGIPKKVEYIPELTTVQETAAVISHIPPCKLG
ncbi:MAG: hypothetical protein AABX24_01725 [Nanoarchaeota archaeon]